jgi:hypothetical protein
MRKYLSALTVTILSACFTVLPAGQASALGNEYLSCLVTPYYYTPTTYANPCYTTGPPQSSLASFGVTFKLFNLSGSYTYSWVRTGTTATVVAGCTSTSSTCSLRAPNQDGEITMTVTLTQNGSSATLESTAYLIQWCGDWAC